MSDARSRYQWVEPEAVPARPPATLGEIWSASRELQSGDNTDAHDRRIERAYKPSIDAINAWRRSRGEPEMSNPVHGIRLQARPDTSDPYAVMGGAAGMAAQATVGQDTAQADVTREIARIRKIDPDFLKGEPDKPEAIMAREIAAEQQRRAQARDVLDRSEGGVAGAVGIAGTIAKSVEDPLVLGTLPIGGGGSTIVGMMAREAALNFGLTLLAQPLVAQNRAEIGEELTTGEAIGNAVGAGGGAGLIVGGVAGVGKLLGGAGADTFEAGMARLYDALPEPIRQRWASAAEMPPSALPDLIEELAPADRITPEARAAINVMRRDAQIAESVPFRAGGANAMDHADRLTGLVDALSSGAPMPVKPRARLATGTALGGTAPAPAGPVERVFESLIVQESGGRAGIAGVPTQWGRAYGLTQVLDSTGAQMAKRLGVPWRPELMRARTAEGAAYQRKIGRAYFDEGLTRYRGDVRKALMYYHGGPDERLWGPKTRAYADSVLARAGVDGGARIAPGTTVADDVGEEAATLARLDAEEIALDAEARALAREGMAGREAGAVDVQVAGERASVEFTTAKGSTYVVESDGTTSRNKAYRAEHGQAEQGPQPRSQRTFYVTADEANQLAVFQARGGPKMAVAIDDGAGQAAVRYVEGADAGKLISGTVVNARSSPEVGMIPVEVWDNGARVHFGNAITEVRDVMPTPGGETVRQADAVRQLLDTDEPDGWLPRLAGAVDTVEDGAVGRLDADDPIWDYIDAAEARELGVAAPANDATPVIEQPEALRAFDAPGGTAQAPAIDSVMHDLRLMAQAAPDMRVRLDPEGEDRALADVIAELDEDDAAIAAVRGCL